MLAAGGAAAAAALLLPAALPCHALPCPAMPCAPFPHVFPCPPGPSLAPHLPQLVVFEGCGHMPQEECPERFVETVQRFVASLDGVEPQPQPQPQPQAEG